tara:strand:+ start:586 stop:2004 length:1419 start_codon:yes stop_codon:yes gene_type:complete
MSLIKFGTDGWRAVIAEGYTFDNLNRVTQATARWILDEKITSNGVVIGYDTRFLSREFAQHSAEVFAVLGIPVRISNSFVPTPAISWAAKHYEALGIVITASHNPPEYNGFKIKAPFGGSASPEQIAGVEEKLTTIKGPIQGLSFDKGLKTGVIRELDLRSGYLDLIAKSININKIKESGIKIAHNPMYGTAIGTIKDLMGDMVVECNNHRDALFGGTAPEPIERNLEQFPKFVLDHQCAIGIANDGDADRIAMVDEKGNFVDSHKMLSLLAKYLHKKKRLTGAIVKTFSTTHMLNKQAADYGLSLIETPIGFKYIAEKMIREDILVGGEESGGLAAKGHLPERDGIYIGLLITEMIVETEKSLSELVQELFDEYGPHNYYRVDLHTEERKKLAMSAYCKAKKLTSIAGNKVVSWDFKDGVKHILEDGSWLLVRQSGTEPVLRIYAEADQKEKAIALVEDTCSWVDNPEILQ